MIIHNMPDAEYFALPGANIHLLMHARRSAMHLRLAMDTESEPTVNMQKGTALHSAVLLGKRIHVAAPDIDRRTKAGKEAMGAFEAEHAGKIVIKPEDAADVDAMIASMQEAPEWKLLAQDGAGEVVLTWDHPVHCFPCKAKVDWLPESHSILLDLKSCQDASPHGFRKALENYGYAAQAAHYLNGATANGIDAETMIFACVESAPPYATAFYYADGETMARASDQVASWCDMYANALKTNQWAGYPRGIHPISARPWAF